MKALSYATIAFLLLIIVLQAVQIHSLDQQVKDYSKACREAQEIARNGIDNWSDCQQSNQELKEANESISKHDRYLLDVMHDHKKVCPIW